MILGLGTDIFAIKRLENLENYPEDAFWKRAFTEREIAEAKGKGDFLPHIAVKFAGKEAVFKAISAYTEGFDPSKIEILDDKRGKPCAILACSISDKIKEHSADFALHLSLSYEEEYAIATAILESL